ncbi:hypothetical Protein YC6258_00437 [Gynuella sunshinyii YC6258]|uniref:Uncharacterized protein n=1 Tax=Gynuella sunshinyii YC6258 TaxID=1445510 RepID=A0A0C5VD69_9GAMM|nr:hypothetical Protein YC6258_00437 [Gynuella sunshinyii YC6258]
MIDYHARKSSNRPITTPGLILTVNIHRMIAGYYPVKCV